MKGQMETNNESGGFSKLVESGVKKLRNYGFINVTAENILSDEVYVFFFSRFLNSQKGKSKELDKQIEMLLCLVKENETTSRTI